MGKRRHSLHFKAFSLLKKTVLLKILCENMGCPIFAKLPTPLVRFCPIVLDPPSPPKIGHHLCTFPKTNSGIDFAGYYVIMKLITVI